MDEQNRPRNAAQVVKLLDSTGVPNISESDNPQSESDVFFNRNQYCEWLTFGQAFDVAVLDKQKGLPCAAGSKVMLDAGISYYSFGRCLAFSPLPADFGFKFENCFRERS